ncbi:MAG: hypothetical protein BA864_14450 [Desulfuromonadales bacterium C00003093]|nr:MAG: hypothetical protein BA864_14450 [Desulfuromonadales bacterium C00003093]
MKQKTKLETAKVWRIPEFRGLELLRAKYVAQSFPRHTHQKYAIGVIEDGALEFYYRGENVVASQGSINLCIPGEVHTGHSASEAGWAYRMFYFDPKLLQQSASEVADYSRPLPFFQSGVIQDNDLAQSFRQLHIKLERQETTLLEQESLLIWTLAQMVLRYADDPPVLHKLGAEHLAVAKIKSYIETNYAENISIDDLTRIAHLSRFHLIRVFRDSVGMPPHTYLRQVRVQQAKEMLFLGKPIVDIAAATGFADQSHLTRWFKRLWGFTPGQYSNSVQDTQL